MWEHKTTTHPHVLASHVAQYFYIVQMTFFKKKCFSCIMCYEHIMTRGYQKVDSCRTTWTSGHQSLLTGHPLNVSRDIPRWTPWTCIHIYIYIYTYTHHIQQKQKY